MGPHIKTVVLDDLVTGWLTKDGEVKQVDINEKTDFSENTSFPKDSKIVITYHTFPKGELYHRPSSISIITSAKVSRIN